MNQAYRTTLAGVVSIVPALNINDAKRVTYLSATDAGYRVRYIDIRVRRAPEYDEWARTASKRCWYEDVVKRLIAAKQGQCSGSNRGK